MMEEKAALAAIPTAPAGEEAVRPKSAGLSFTRRLSRQGVDPYTSVDWETRDANIQGEGGKSVFEQRGVEFPAGWSQLATNVVASKYFRGHLGTPQREHSVRQLLGRVVTTIVGWGEEQGYFADLSSRDIFRDELTHLLLEQEACFNSPVWFNVGVEPKPQCSACFILS
ncbi:MAG: vitamin B12-dependent ribonucleotide reductase, partial [Vicinamibacterales bacterium]